MKISALLVLLILTSITMVCYAPSKRGLASYNYSADNIVIEERINTKQLELFLNHLGNKESGGNWKITNHLNCMGKFQISEIALLDINYKGTNIEFINDSIVQKECMLLLLKKNKLYLKHYLKYTNTTIRGVKITLSGLLAATHLAGIGNVKRFINSGYNATDCNGSSVIKYINEFNNYKLII